jgi:hypothetical protein
VRTPFRKGEQRRTVRLLSTTAALGLVVATVAIAQPASAAVPTFPDNVVVFPDRDFVSIEGYERYAGETALVQVLRNGTVMGSTRGVVSGTDVAFEINHPGGECWGAGTNLQVTPDIKAGDVVAVTFPDGTVEETTTSSATASDMVRVDPLTVRVDGTFGADVDPGFLEQRIIQPDFVDTAVGKRDIRAVPGGPTAGPNGGYVSTLDVDPAAGTLRATYQFDTADLADIAMAADLGERAMNWQVQDPDGNRQGLTIAEFGEAGGPGMGGCPLGPGQQEAPAGGATAVRTNQGASMSVSWTPVAPQPGAAAVTGYNVELVETGGTGPAAIIGQRLGTNAQSATINGLDPAKNYTVEVRSMTGTEPKLSAPFTIGAASPQVGDTTPPTLTVSPSGAGTVLADQVTVNTDGQAFFILTPLGADPVPVVSADGPSDAAKLVNGPISITEPSHLSVVSFDQAGNSSGVVEGDYAPAPLPALPAAPTGLGGTVTQNSASLTWTASPASEGVTGYQVRVTAPAGQTVTQPPVTSVPRQTITGLQPGTQYTFAVAAINKAGTGAFSAPITRSTDAATDRVTISSAKWKARDFKVVGTGSQLGTTVRLFFVNPDGTKGAQIPNASTTVVAAAPPAVGDWTIRLRDGAAPATNPGRIIAESSGGGTAGPFNVSNG